MLEQALIIAGGRGKRMGHLTQNKPKCLIEVAGYPILKYQLDCLTEVKKIIISVNYHSGKAIKQYVQNAYPQLNCVFSYSEQKGVAYAIYSALKAINTRKSILITVADVICLSGYQILIDKLRDGDLVLGITTQPPIANKAYTQAFIDRNGSLQITSERNLKLSSSLAGVYALNNTKLFFQYLSESINSVTSGRLTLSSAIERETINSNNEFRLSHVFRHLSQKNYTVDLVDLGECCEINYPEDIEIATEKLRS